MRCCGSWKGCRNTTCAARWFRRARTCSLGQARRQRRSGPLRRRLLPRRPRTGRRRGAGREVLMRLWRCAQNRTSRYLPSYRRTSRGKICGADRPGWPQCNSPMQIGAERSTLPGFRKRARCGPARARSALLEQTRLASGRRTLCVDGIVGRVRPARRALGRGRARPPRGTRRCDPACRIHAVRWARR